jgi:hypothetical protein
MAFRLELLYRAPKTEEDVVLVSQDDPTEDPVVAFANLRLLQNRVMAELKTAKEFRKIKDEQFSRRITLIEPQLKLDITVPVKRHRLDSSHTNGKRTMSLADFLLSEETV